MDVTYSEAELAFRDEVRAFFRNGIPEDIRRKQDAEVPLDWTPILKEECDKVGIAYFSSREAMSSIRSI